MLTPAKRMNCVPEIQIFFPPNMDFFFSWEIHSQELSCELHNLAINPYFGSDR